MAMDGGRTHLYATTGGTPIVKGQERSLRRVSSEDPFMDRSSVDSKESKVEEQ